MKKIVIPILLIAGLFFIIAFVNSNPVVQSIMKQRYGKNIPYHEKVIAPSQVYESEVVETVFDNY